MFSAEELEREEIEGRMGAEGSSGAAEEEEGVPLVSLRMSAILALGLWSFDCCSEAEADSYEDVRARGEAGGMMSGVWVRVGKGDEAGA